MTIQANTTATNEQYNAMLTSIKTVLRRTETGYGVLPNGVSIADGIITADQWAKLHDDVERINVHVFDENFDSIDPSWLPAPGNRLRRDYVNTIASAIDNCLNNRYTAHPNQLSAQSCSSTRTTFWGSGNPEGISFVSEHVWPATDTANFFFNLGGYFTPTITYVPGSDAGSQYPDLEQIIKDLINESTSVIQQPFNQSKWVQAKQDINKTYQVSYEKDVTLGNSTATFTATTIYQIIDNSEQENAVRVSVKLIPDSAVVGLGGNIELNVVSTLTSYCSIGTRGGIGAVAPETTVVSTFEDAAAIAGSRKIVTLATDRLDYSTTFVGGGQGSPIRVYVSNIASNPATASTATITAIQLSNYGADASYNAILPIVIPPGETRYFDVVYQKTQVTSRNLGTFINSMRIISNNTNGDLVIPISVTITKPNFAVTPENANIVSSLLSYKTLYTTFKLVPSFGRITSITPVSLSGPSSFFIEKPPSPSYPTIRMRYTPVDVNDGQYQYTADVKTTGVDLTGIVSTVTNTLTWTVNQNIQDQHLGHWLSAKGPNNSVVGISYDIIDSTRYITIGIGMGADGSEILHKTGLNFVNIDNLNYQADPSFSGPSLYRNAPNQIASSWTQFLKDYGVWFLPFIGTPINELFVYNFTIDVPETKTYNVRYSVDDLGYIDIDGNRIIDLSSTTRAWATTYTKDVALTAGKHTVTISGKNTGGPGAVAAAIFDGNTAIWSTLSQVKNNAYAHWSEVYRVPLSDSPGNYYVGGTSYLIKDCRMNNGLRYSDQFNIDGGNSRMFLVKHDGDGNIEILIGGVTKFTGDSITLNSLLYSFYYYEWKLSRYNQLYDGTQNGTTPYFKGFDSNGAVLTVMRSVPDPEVPSVQSGNVSTPVISGSGYDTVEWDPIEMMWVWEWSQVPVDMTETYTFDDGTTLSISPDGTVTSTDTDGTTTTTSPDGTTTTTSPDGTTTTTSPVGSGTAEGTPLGDPTGLDGAPDVGSQNDGQDNGAGNTDSDTSSNSGGGGYSSGGYSNSWGGGGYGFGGGTGGMGD